MITLDAFRKDKTLVGQMKQFRAGPLWPVIEQVLLTSHPARYDSANFTIDQSAMWQKHTSGYEKALNVLEAMAEESAPPITMETEYVPSKKKEPTKE